MNARVSPTVVVISLLAAWNVLINQVIPSPAYVPANLAMAGLLLMLARRWGVGRRELGLEPIGLRRGVRVGLAVALAAIGVIVALASWGWSRRFFEDGTLVELAVAGMLYQVAVRIPLGTALFEEIAFRGVLFAALRRDESVRSAAIGSSVAFGFWHVLPTLGRLDLNPAGDYAVNGLAEVGLVGLFVVVTSVAGLGFVWLRVRTAGLVAPILVHAAINASAFFVGWLIAG